jgi:DNA-directed RNA polymerase specialized sigma24 family protein
MPGGWAAALPQDTIDLTEAIRSLSPPLRDVLVLHCCEAIPLRKQRSSCAYPRHGEIPLSRARSALKDILKEEP